LDLRHSRRSWGNVRWKAPEVIVAGAAAELTSAAPIAEVVEILRAEFDRTCLDGRVGLCIYVGPTPDYPDGPADDLLVQLEALDGLDYMLVQSDADARGRRASYEDAVQATGLTLYYLIADERVRKCLVVESPLVSIADRRFSGGVRRLSLDEQPIHSAVCNHLKARLFDCLFHSPVGSDHVLAPSPDGGITADALNPQWGLDGSVAGIEQAIEADARERSDELEKSLMHEAADCTRNHLLALIPPEVPVRPGWVVRLIQWLVSLVRMLLRLVRRKPTRVHRTGATVPVSAAPSTKALVDAETIYIRLKSLECVMQPSEPPNEPTESSSPLDVALIDLPGVREAALARLPDAEELASQLARSLPFRALLAESDDPDNLRARLDALCRNALRLNSRGRLFALEDYQPWIAELAQDVSAFVPGHVSRVCRLLLHDPDLPPIADLGDFIQEIGDRNEVVAFEFVRGLSFERLTRNGRKSSSHVQSNSAPASDCCSARY
jgi:hypothetical protein